MSVEMLILLKLLLVAAIAVAIYGIARRAMQTLGSRDLLSPQATSIFTGIIKWALIISVILIGLNTIGISVTSLWASLSALFMLVAIGFVAVWSILSNASSALFLVVFAPFRIGDDVEILEPAGVDPAKPGIRGRVTDISFIYTTIECDDGEEGKSLYRVPNNQFFQKAIRCRQGSNTKSLKQALMETPLHEEQRERDEEKNAV